MQSRESALLKEDPTVSVMRVQTLAVILPFTFTYFLSVSSNLQIYKVSQNSNSKYHKHEKLRCLELVIAHSQVTYMQLRYCKEKTNIDT